MKYVFDHYALLYMLEQFPRNIALELWEIFDGLCKNGTIISQREALKCLEREAIEVQSLDWSKKNSSIFHTINENEAQFLGELMKKREFDFLNTPRLAERRMPEAIPFILCIAKKQQRHYVYRKNTNIDYSNRIMKICKSYKIKCLEVEDCLMGLRKIS